MEQLSQQQQLLKSIIDKELYEIEEEVSNEDNSDISTVIAFHIKHGLRDVEQRVIDNEDAELEYPYGTSEELVKSMNPQLLQLELNLQYYYHACYFGTDEEKAANKDKILNMIDISFEHLDV
ncbi:MAG: hypothetical protein GY694_14175 [Gammaproteobacteria bacterium]|nr:hypothetical protein [Gammaproteobacteria bacterium]